MTDSLVDRLRRYDFNHSGGETNVKYLRNPDGPEAANVLTALEGALDPFAALMVPTKPQGNAGIYSIRFSDIAKAQAALSLLRGDGK